MSLNQNIAPLRHSCFQSPWLLNLVTVQVLRPRWERELNLMNQCKWRIHFRGIFCLDFGQIDPRPTTGAGVNIVRKGEQSGVCRIFSVQPELPENKWPRLSIKQVNMTLLCLESFYLIFNQGYDLSFTMTKSFKVAQTSSKK